MRVTRRIVRQQDLRSQRLRIMPGSGFRRERRCNPAVTSACRVIITVPSARRATVKIHAGRRQAVRRAPIRGADQPCTRGWPDPSHSPSVGRQLPRVAIRHNVAGTGMRQNDFQRSARAPPGTGAQTEWGCTPGGFVHVKGRAVLGHRHLDRMVHQIAGDHRLLPFLS